MKQEEVRIGVYICQCGTNISGTVDTKEIVEFVRGMPSVVIAKDYIYMCSDPGQNMIKEDIKQHKLNRVVVASCSPNVHEHTFRQAVQGAGLNPYLFEMANIREQCSWVTEDPKLATEKAKALVSAAVKRIYFQTPLEVREVPVTPSILVVGGGIAGIQTSLEIANSGYKVYLVEREPSIGGHMAQFDKTFPTLDCASCIFTPLLSSVGQHPNIELLTYSEVKEFSGYIGNYKAKILKKARYVDEAKCNSCMVCVEKCPYKAVSEFDEGLTERKAIYTPFAQAVPNVPVIDTEYCVYFKKGTCRACEKFCDIKAIDFEQINEEIEVEVGAVIIATGYDSFDPSVISDYGYRHYDGVITALQFERLCNASGPTNGKILLNDGSEPESVAIIHCVGSRDENYNEYCSNVCCMYSLKHSHLIKEKIEDIEVYEFYIDMRCFSKGFEEFYKRLSNEGVKFVRGKVGEITDRAISDEEQGKLVVVAEDTLMCAVVRVPVDMIILSTALQPRSDAESVARLFNINRSADGFFMERHPKLDPVATATDGIYVVGCAQGPKDIPYSVSQASGAAARVIAMVNQGKVVVEAATAVIDEDRCSGCKICNLLCPYNAITFDEEKGISIINEVQCKGCGVCVAACPSAAITGKHFTSPQIIAEIEGVLV
ncbi:MAG: CoB--CoM heterodisulfide reductase iron-sulfur subunit A family protein [Dehalococcoidales bacterium]|nr:MAG: CoB--CoM heterodisulfide reductase iron-sulfur subunit A family protein [Dehalococcoidales bacterium]